VLLKKRELRGEAHPNYTLVAFIRLSYNGAWRKTILMFWKLGQALLKRTVC